jgi:hypothetical protein
MAMDPDVTKPPAEPSSAPLWRRRPTSDRTRTIARWMFHSHLWMGVAFTGVVLLICLTGILLNHKRTFGLMPDVDHVAMGTFEEALPLATLARLATESAGADAAAAGIGRMDVRPDDGLVKVRFDDNATTEVTMDLVTGDVLNVGERNDVFIEKLHSGEIFGDDWILLSDAAAIALALLVISGYWMWLYPRSGV